MRATGTLLIAAINQAAEGQADVAPVEVALEGTKERWGPVLRHAGRFGRERRRSRHRAHARDHRARCRWRTRSTSRRRWRRWVSSPGGIAHDFNNVLSAIMMCERLPAERAQADRPVVPGHHADQAGNATRAATLVRQLLAFSRRQTLRPQVLDLGDALSDLAMLLRRLIGEKVKHETIHGRDLWPVKVDVSQFEQVIVNLAVNAARRDAGWRQADHSAPPTSLQKKRPSSPTRALPAADYGADRGRSIPAPASLPTSATRSSSRSSRPRKSARAPASGCPPSTASSSQTGGFIYVDSEPGQGTLVPYLPAAPRRRA